MTRVTILQLMALLVFTPSVLFAQDHFMNAAVIRVRSMAKQNNLVVKTQKLKSSTSSSLSQAYNDLKDFSSPAQDMAKYGFDLYRSVDSDADESRVRLRGGVSGASRGSAAGVQLIVNW